MANNILTFHATDTHKHLYYQLVAHISGYKDIPTCFGHCLYLFSGNQIRLCKSLSMIPSEHSYKL